jgi:hypothetical protein
MYPAATLCTVAPQPASQPARRARSCEKYAASSVATNGGAFHDDALQSLRDAPDDCE